MICKQHALRQYESLEKNTFIHNISSNTLHVNLADFVYFAKVPIKCNLNQIDTLSIALHTASNIGVNLQATYIL